MAIREELLNLIIVLLKSQSYTTDAGPGVSGVSKIRKKVGDQKIYISRTAIQPKMSKIENYYWKTSKLIEK